MSCQANIARRSLIKALGAGGALVAAQAVAPASAEGMLPVTDEEAANLNMRDVFEEGLTEAVEIDGLAYVFSYYENANGDRYVDYAVTDGSDAHTVVTKANSGLVEVDGKVVGKVALFNDAYSRAWVSLGTGSFVIEWYAAITVAAFAGAAVTALGGAIGASAFITNVSSGVISSIISMSANTKVSWELFYERYDPYVEYAYSMRFKCAGKNWGPYWVPASF